MALTPGPTQAAGTLAATATAVLTSAIQQTVALHLDIVTAATIDVSITPAGGSITKMYAGKAFAAGDHAVFDGIALGIGDVLTVTSNQADGTYFVQQCSSPTNPSISVTSSAGAVRQTTPTQRAFASYYLPTTLGAAVDAPFFVATRACTVKAISEVHGVAAGGTSTIQVVKDTGTSAPGAGTDLLATPFNLNATANTVQSGALSATASDLILAAGDRLSVDFANAIQSTTTLAITVELEY